MCLFKICDRTNWQDVKKSLDTRVLFKSPKNTKGVIFPQGIVEHLEISFKRYELDSSISSISMVLIPGMILFLVVVVFYTITFRGWMIDLTCFIINRISVSFIVTSNWSITQYDICLCGPQESESSEQFQACCTPAFAVEDTYEALK